MRRDLLQQVIMGDHLLQQISFFLFYKFHISICFCAIYVDFVQVERLLLIVLLSFDKSIRSPCNE